MEIIYNFLKKNSCKLNLTYFLFFLAYFSSLSAQTKWKCAVDSAEWSKRSVHKSIVFDNKIWIIKGVSTEVTYSDVWYSSDGASWIQATDSAFFPMDGSYSCLNYNDKMWVIGGRDFHFG